jgi:hypothetical protein
MKFSLILALLMSTSTWAASIKTVCGVRTGTMGSASLVWAGKDQLVLANGPSQQQLLEEADHAVSTQNGTAYCLNLQTTSKTTHVVGGYRVEDYITTICGVRGGSFGNAFLQEGKKVVLTLASQGGAQKLLDQADTLITGGTQVGKNYCLNVQMIDGKADEIVAAFKNF